MEPLLPDNYKLTVTRQKKFNVTCQLLKFSYSASKGAILLRVRSDIGDRLKLWILCNSEKECQKITEDLEHYDYWRFHCYSTGQILRREPISSLSYKCVVQ
jgi:hypothetical protein